VEADLAALERRRTILRTALAELPGPGSAMQQEQKQKHKQEQEQEQEQAHQQQQQQQQRGAQQAQQQQQQQAWQEEEQQQQAQLEQQQQHQQHQQQQQQVELNAAQSGPVGSEAAALAVTQRQAALVALAAVPRPEGEAGQMQDDRLERWLATPEPRTRGPVLSFCTAIFGSYSDSSYKRA
jgi:hypothetical protein